MESSPQEDGKSWDVGAGAVEDSRVSSTGEIGWVTPPLAKNSHSSPTRKSPPVDSPHQTFIPHSW